MVAPSVSSFVACFCLPSEEVVGEVLPHLVVSDVSQWLWSRIPNCGLMKSRHCWYMVSWPSELPGLELRTEWLRAPEKTTGQSEWV